MLNHTYGWELSNICGENLQGQTERTIAPHTTAKCDSVKLEDSIVLEG